ncbi:hypothetical protein [Nonomuraea angiospora]|uniref:hypothetical protein n=1 Tax=Nonomuraea angiospora TaxID=46172 RepID=UPI0029BB2982|nr:hypothetical protein [Nonomuraea angiospora]MDX3110140.1 hypothetical protein [Nonomuraea angiospora]
MSFDDIRQRLAALEGIDWSTVERQYDAEYYTDWLRVGPVMLPTTFSPSPEDQADAAQAEAVAVFLQHAVADMRQLLEELERRDG